MNFTTPMLEKITVLDIHNPNTIHFDVIGGQQVKANRLTIQDMSNNIVYQKIQTRMGYYHNLEAFTEPNAKIKNGFQYKMFLQTGDGVGPWSDPSSMIFWCYSTPEVKIINIEDNIVPNQTFNFEAEYSQAEGEPMQSYMFLLYNIRGELLTTFREVYSDGFAPFSQEITGLKNGEQYYVEVKTISPNGNQTSSRERFMARYTAPELAAALETINLPEQGSIKVSANIVQVLMGLYDPKGNEIPGELIEFGPPGDLVKKEWLDMNREDYDKLITSDGFNIGGPTGSSSFKEGGDFFARIRCKDIPDKKIFFVLRNEVGHLKMRRLGDRLLVYKGLNLVRFNNFFESKSYPKLKTSDPILIQIKQVNNQIEIKVLEEEEG